MRPARLLLIGRGRQRQLLPRTNGRLGASVRLASGREMAAVAVSGGGGAIVVGSDGGGGSGGKHTVPAVRAGGES